MENTPFAAIILNIEPNYDIETNKDKVNKEVGNFLMARQQMVPNLDLTVIEGNPVA
jgi:hypothetical protein